MAGLAAQTAIKSYSVFIYEHGILISYFYLAQCFMMPSRIWNMQVNQQFFNITMSCMKNCLLCKVWHLKLTNSCGCIFFFQNLMLLLLFIICLYIYHLSLYWLVACSVSSGYSWPWINGITQGIPIVCEKHNLFHTFFNTLFWWYIVWVTHHDLFSRVAFTFKYD